MKYLYKFHWDCGRMGDVQGIFTEEESEVEAAIGKEVYFGEVLGKHSDVHGKLEEDALTVLTDDQDFIAKFEQLVGDFGLNPLDYIAEGQDE